MRRVLIAAIVLVVLVGACGGDDAATTSTAAPTPSTAPPATSPTTTTAMPSTTTTVDAVVDIAVAVVGDTVTVTVEGIPAPGRVDVAIGAMVRLTVSADAADEAHLHGYDLTGEVTPDAPAVIEFIADIPGIFEVEFEASHRLLVELQVS